MKKKGKIHLILNRLQTMYAIRFHEHTWKYKDINLKHLLFTAKNSDTLVVSFPACAENGARYNFMRSLSRFKCNKLFLLDNFASNGRGNYLIGPGVEETVVDLINHIVQERGIKQLIFVGSSKGGYSALNFSFHFPNVKACIGAPPYFLGYRIKRADFLPNLVSIVGDPITDDALNKLNQRLRNKVLNPIYKPEIIALHYSNKEHTYDNHVKFILEDLKTSGIQVVEDIADYPKHGEIAYYYPSFMEKTIEEWLKK